MFEKFFKKNNNKEINDLRKVSIEENNKISIDKDNVEKLLTGYQRYVYSLEEKVMEKNQIICDIQTEIEDKENLEEIIENQNLEIEKIKNRNEKLDKRISTQKKQLDRLKIAKNTLQETIRETISKKALT